MTSVSLRFRVVGRVRPPRQSRGVDVLLPFVAVLSTIGAVAAGVAHNRNDARLLQYQHDAVCIDRAVVQVSAPQSMCAVEQAQVVARWFQSHRGSRDYYVALRAADGAADGGVDSVELKGRLRFRVWTAAPAGAWLFAQRFDDAESRTSRVTIVRTGSLVSRTAWNPVWRSEDTIAGVVFMSLVAVATLIAMAYRRALSHARPAATFAFETARER